jgi:hypothetical protein
MKQNITLRISPDIKEKLFNAVPKGERNVFVEDAIAEKMQRSGFVTPAELVEMYDTIKPEHEQRSPQDGC